MKVQSIRFCDRSTDVDLYQLQTLLNKSAFWAIDRRIEDLKIAVDRSEPVISVWDEDKLIGFARANSDGVYRATIWDVVIDCDYQRLGLGRKLVETVLAHPCMKRVERIYLTTTHQQNFYERLGFVINSSTTMRLDLANRLEIPPVGAIHELPLLVDFEDLSQLPSVNFCKHSEDKS